jgi:hypothetical protein
MSCTGRVMTYRALMINLGQSHSLPRCGTDRVQVRVPTFEAKPHVTIEVTVNTLDCLFVITIFLAVFKE